MRPVRAARAAPGPGGHPRGRAGASGESSRNRADTSGTAADTPGAGRREKEDTPGYRVRQTITLGACLNFASL